jgi:hypothetical protein
MLFDPKKQLATPLRCDDCWVDMAHLGSQGTDEVFVSTIVERHFFFCVDCGRLGYKVELWPKKYKRMETGEIALVSHTDNSVNW